MSRVTGDELRVVAAAYRGNSLGRCLKAAMMRWLRADRPQIAQVATETDAGNTYMIEINRQVGYVVDYVSLSMEAGVAELEARIVASSSKAD